MPRHTKQERSSKGRATAARRGGNASTKGKSKRKKNALNRKVRKARRKSSTTSARVA